MRKREFWPELNPNLGNHSGTPLPAKEDFFLEKSDLSICYLEAPSLYDYGLKVGKQFRTQYKLLNILANFIKNDKADEEDKRKCFDLPNWDNEIFKAISGIDVEKELNEKPSVDNKPQEIIIDGVSTREKTNF